MIKPDDAKKPVVTKTKSPVTKTKTATTKPVASKATVKSVTKAVVKATAKPAVKIAKPVIAKSKAVAVKTVVAKPAAKAKPAAEPKVKKPKLVRDSFTMPEAEYQVLGDMKKAALKAGFEVKKSELLRVGVALIQKLDTAKLKEILASLPPLKAGRPKNEK